MVLWRKKRMVVDRTELTSFQVVFNFDGSRHPLAWILKPVESSPFRRTTGKSFEL